MPVAFKTLFFILLLVLAGNSLTVYYHTTILTNHQTWVSHTFQALAAIESLRADVKTAGTSVRSYVITNDPVFLPSLTQAKDQIEIKAKRLARLTSDNPIQVQNNRELDLRLRERFSQLEKIVQLQAVSASNDVLRIFRETFITPEDRSVDRLLDRMIEEENRLLTDRTRNSDQSLKALNAVVSLVLALDVLFVILIYYLFQKYLQERAAAEQRFRAVFDQAAVGIEQSDESGKIITVNPKLSQMLGFPPDELIGKAWNTLVHPDELPQSTHNNTRLFMGEISSYSMEKRYLRKDGSPVWVALTTSAVRLTEDKTHYRLSIIQDITDRKRSEEDRERLLKEAQTANRLKDEFLLTVTHELRTPLNIVMGHAELLEYEEPGSQDYQISLEAIKKGAKTQLKLVEDLLDVSAIQSGRLSFDPQRIDLNQIIESIVDGFRHTAQTKNIEIAYFSTQPNALIAADEVRLRQIFWNLLSNAIKFTPNGGRVTVEILKGSDGYLVKVADTGQGIDPSFLPHIFERFRQEDGSLTRRHGGLGLGLSITRQLVELHGGTIRAFSAGRNYGTAFVVMFPALHPKIDAPWREVSPSIGAQSPEMQGNLNKH